jgi:hypothetical protein
MMLTKSDFLTYLDAPMHLWAKAHDQCEPKSPTPFEQFLIQQGQQVETLARTYIENEILPHYEDARLLWQPSYNDGRFEVRADALVWDRTAQAYDLFEIKSAASVHPEHTYDLAFQVLLLESILKLRHTTIIHINKGYLYGDSLDLSQFFTFEEISDKVQKRRESIAQLRQEAWHVTRLEKPQPVFACINPRTCPCPDLCHPSLPSNPVYDLPYLGKKAIKLREMGITAIEDIPESFNLNPKQSKLVQAVKHRQPMIETSMIRQALSELRFPLHFLDYETFSPAIPLFPDYHPYEHILFQYSLVIVDAPQAAPKRIDFLFTENKDPAPSFATHLLSHLGTMGSVIVWNQGFEASRNKQLARHCPKQAHDLLAINERLFDLMRIFKDGLYIHPAFHGSASLKTVLPVLCPELGYEGLRINSGEEASLTWYHLHKGLIPGEKQAEIKAALKAYCYNDTFGLYAIWKHLFAL